MYRTKIDNTIKKALFTAAKNPVLALIINPYKLDSNYMYFPKNRLTDPALIESLLESGIIELDPEQIT